MGNKATLSGGSGDNTLTGGQGENIFVHSNGAKDLITNYAAGRDVIILESGKVSETLTSGNDVILKIASNNGSDLGTITVQNGKNKSLAICDEEYNNRQKEIFQKFSTAYIKAAIKAFEEDEDVQNILTDGENSAALAEIKELNPTLAKNIADALQGVYTAANEYFTIFGENAPSASQNVASDSLLQKSSSVASDSLPQKSSMSDTISEWVSNADDCASVLQEIGDCSPTSKLGKAVSKVTGPVSSAISTMTIISQATQLTKSISQSDRELLGRSDYSVSQKIGHVYSKNPEAFDAFAKSTLDFVAGLAATGIGGLLGGGVGAAVATIALRKVFEKALGDWYDNFIKPHLEELADDFDDFNGYPGPQSFSNNDANHTISGGTGADTLSGGAGNDSLYGGLAMIVFTEAQVMIRFGVMLVLTHLLTRAATVMMLSSVSTTMTCFKSPEHFPPAIAKKREKSISRSILLPMLSRSKISRRQLLILTRILIKSAVQKSLRNKLYSQNSRNFSPVEKLDVFFWCIAKIS